MGSYQSLGSSLIYSRHNGLVQRALCVAFAAVTVARWQPVLHGGENHVKNLVRQAKRNAVKSKW
jgi:hypothetical protein